MSEIATKKSADAFVGPVSVMEPMQHHVHALDPKRGFQDLKERTETKLSRCV